MQPIYAERNGYAFENMSPITGLQEDKDAFPLLGYFHTHL